MDNIIECINFSYNGYQVVRGEFFAHIKEPLIITKYMLIQLV